MRVIVLQYRLSPGSTWVSSHKASGTDFYQEDLRFNSPILLPFSLIGFKRKEFRGKLAIAITANFINRNTTAEAKVEEISGVAFIFNQKFFLDLKEETGVTRWSTKFLLS